MDAELLVYSLLKARFPAVNVTDAPDKDAVKNLPILIYAGTSADRVANGPRGAGETWVFALSVVDSNRVAAKDLASEVSDAMQEFYESGASVNGAGHVTYIDETSLFVRAPQNALTADDLHQYNGVFTVIVRP